MIELTDVDKTYVIDKNRPVHAVCGVNLHVDPGEFVIITGRSGSGKTTLLNLISGLAAPTRGKVTFNGQEIGRLPDRQQSHLRNQKIGFVFQFPSLMPSLTVEENVLLPTLFGPQREQSQAATQRAGSLLDQVGLTDKRRAFPRQLSAGQQQRVVIARSLMNQPDLLLADEPTSDLDEQTEKEVMALFQEIHSQTGITILLVTHTHELVHYGTRSLHMVNGAIAAV
jgi:putative ABC transport system ATP-binding protein/lipoprotein-releasing system ATP-binding protein